MPFSLNPAAPEFVSPSSSPIADSHMAFAMSQQSQMMEDCDLEANLSEHDLEELEEAEAWIALQAELAEQEEEQEQLLFQQLAARRRDSPAELRAMYRKVHDSDAEASQASFPH